MDDTTTTDVNALDTGAEPAQPVDAAPDAAAPAQPTTTDNETTEPSRDENLDWLKAKGVDPTSPEALAKVAEMYRNAEKAMHQSTTKASELEKSLTADIPTVDQVDNGLVNELIGEVVALKTTQTVNDFFAANPEARALEEKMTEIVMEKPALGQLVRAGQLTLNDIYAMAQASSGALDQAKQQGGREALEKVAQKQQARVPEGKATVTEFATTNVTKENFDSWYAGLSAADRAKPENQAIVNSLLA